MDQPDYSRHDRNPRVAEGVHGLVAPSRQQFVRRRGGDVAVSVTRWDELAWTRPLGAPRRAAGSSAASEAAASGCAAQRLARGGAAGVWWSARSLSLDFATTVAAGGAAQRLVGLAAH